MTRTSRARRLNVVEPTPDRHEPQEPPAQEPPVGDSEVPQPDGAVDPDLHAISTGMSLLLHLALRLMRSHRRQALTARARRGFGR
jgi:hypothetical protein